MNLEAIKQLRERTFLSMTVCKKALEQTNGDVDKAVEFLQKQGTIKTVDPLVIPREGRVQAKVVNNVGRIAEINCQTDFAAKSEIFISFIDRFLDSGLVRKDLLQRYFTTTERGQLLCQQLGEKVVIKRADQLWLDTLSLPEKMSSYAGVCRHYNHHSGKIAVLLGAAVDPQLVTEPKILNFLDDCAMQIAATKPRFLSSDPLRMDESDIALCNTQIEIFREQVKDKPEKMRDKIVAGKLEAWYREVALLNQESVIVPKKTVQNLQEEIEKGLDCKIFLQNFIRYELGM